jgi:hypothetical protein
MMMLRMLMGCVLGVVSFAAVPLASSAESMAVCLVLSNAEGPQWSYVFDIDDVTSQEDTMGAGNGYRLYSLHGVRVLRNGVAEPNLKSLSPVSGTALLNWNDTGFIDSKFTITESDGSPSVLTNEAAVTRVRLPIFESDEGGVSVTDSPEWTRVEVPTGETTRVAAANAVATVIGEAVNTTPDCMRPSNPN